MGKSWPCASGITGLSYALPLGVSFPCLWPVVCLIPMCSWRFSPIPAILAGCYQPLGSFGSFFLGKIPGYSGRIDSDPLSRELVPVCPIGIRAGTFVAVLRAAPGQFFQPADQPSVESFDLCGASGFVKSDYGFFLLVCQAHAGFLLFAVKILHFTAFRACVSFRNETNCFLPGSTMRRLGSPAPQQDYSPGSTFPAIGSGCLSPGSAGQG